MPTAAWAEVCDKGADAQNGAFGLVLLALISGVPLLVAMFWFWRAWLWLWPAACAAVLALAAYVDLTTTNPAVRYMIEAAVREGCGWRPGTSLAVWTGLALTFVGLWGWNRRWLRNN